jgi:DNA-binding CsgD family transcriptional regulator
MGEPLPDYQLTADERQALARLRQGPQSLHELAETLGLNLEQTQNVIQRLNRKIGLVRLFRSTTLRYGLAE